MTTLVNWMLSHMNCKRFARHVASDDLAFKGDLFHRAHFWLHWMICPFCRRYWSEIRAIGRELQTRSTLAQHPALKIEDVKQRIKARLLKGTA